MKNKIFTLISLTLLGGALALPSTITRVRADEHVHSYVNGVCSCNAHLFEAEDGIIEGINTDSDHSEQWVWEVTSTNPNHPTSGGKDVEYWAATGNTITWKFKLNEQLTNIGFRFWISTGQVDRSTAGLQIATNGIKGKFSTKMVIADDSWYNFQEVDGTLSFAEGNNEVVLMNKGANPFNIDCVEFYFPSTTVVSDFASGEPLGEVPSQDTPIVPVNPLDPYTTNKSLFMEAEYATEVVGTPANDNEVFFEDADGCSGGACIANFGQEGDNIARWEFTTDKAVTEATITIYLCCPSLNQEWDSLMIPRINAGSGGAAPFDKYPQDPSVKGIKVTTTNTSFVDFHTFSKLDLPTVSLLEGKNVFEIESFNCQLVNIDYVKITTTEDVNFTFTPVNHGFGGKSGATMLEAEKGIVEGQSSDTHGESMILTGVTSDNPDHPTSGTGCVGNFGTRGNKITWVFKSTAKVDSFNIFLWVAGCSSGGAVNDVISFTINDEDIDIDDTFPSYPGGDKWYDWVSIPVTGCSLVEGKNVIVLENISGQPFNVDGIYLDVPSSVTIIPGDDIDVKAPEISMISIKTLEIKTYAEIEFTFDYEDDVTAKDKLSVTVSVYFAYKTADQEKMAVVDNKFTPEKLGDYTIIVNVEDEGGNIGTQKRYLKVKFEGDAPVDPNKDTGEITEGEVKFVDPRVRGGWITFGVCMAAAAGLIATMVVLGKKRV